MLASLSFLVHSMIPTFLTNIEFHFREFMFIPSLYAGIQCLNVLRLRAGARSTLAIGSEAEKLLGIVLF